MVFGARGQYLSLCGNEELKDNSKHLGIQSLILSIIGTIIVIGCVAAASYFAGNVSSTMSQEQYNFPISSFILAIVFYAFALVGFLGGVLEGISFATYQKKLNKQKIGIAALVVSLVGLGISIIGTILLIVFMV